MLPMDTIQNSLENPLALKLLEITRTILIKDFFVFEYLTSDLRLLPLPLIKTAVFFLPDNFSTQFYFF